MSISETIGIEPQWRLAEGEVEGQAVLIRLRCNIEAAVAHEGLGTCIQFTVAFPEDVETTQLDEEKAAFLEELESVFIDQIEEQGIALCCLIYNIENQVDYTFYADTLQPFVDFVSDYQVEGVEMSVGSAEEPDWNSYREMYQGIMDNAE